MTLNKFLPLPNKRIPFIVSSSVTSYGFMCETYAIWPNVCRHLTITLKHALWTSHSILIPLCSYKKLNFSLLWKLFHRCWSVIVGICDHSALVMSSKKVWCAVGRCSVGLSQSQRSFSSKFIPYTMSWLSQMWQKMDQQFLNFEVRGWGFGFARPAPWLS